MKKKGGAKEVGCFRDKGKRDLGSRGFLRLKRYMTQAICAYRCKRFNTKYFGVQNGDECFCGNTHGKYGKAENCDKDCTGTVKKAFFGSFEKKTQNCGGALANKVFTNPVYR